jgi:hypothetical protein
VKEFLTNLGLKTGDPLQEDSLEGTVDVHPVNDAGYSALTMIVLARYFIRVFVTFVCDL